VGPLLAGVGLLLAFQEPANAGDVPVLFAPPGLRSGKARLRPRRDRQSRCL